MHRARRFGAPIASPPRGKVGLLGSRSSNGPDHPAKLFLPETVLRSMEILHAGHFGLPVTGRKEHA